MILNKPFINNIKHQIMKNYFFIVGLFIVTLSNAQTFQIGINGYTPLLFGDITESSIDNPSAGYVESAYGGNFEFMFYTKSNWGFGVKVSYSEYLKNIDNYKTDLLKKLDINEDKIIMQSLFTYRHIGFQLGASHSFNVIGKFNIEPYIFFGAGVFTSPIEEITYFKNGKTYTQKKSITGFATINYTPGLKFQWNLIDKHLGLSLYVEYDGISMQEWSEETVTYTSDSFEKASTTTKYSINSINIGGGVSYRFGKGLNNN